MEARAIVIAAPNRVEVQAYELPEIHSDEVMVRTEYSGVSQGTEVWALTGRRPEVRFPTVPGYQSVGIIEAVGSDVSGYKTGERVLFTTSRLPDDFPTTWMGGHVSHALVRAIAPGTPVPVPEGTDPVAAAVAALPAVSLRGISMLDVGIGDLVVVNGQGLIGQGSAQLARLRGATVLATDLSPTRLGLSKRFSADIVVNPREQDLAGVLRSLRPEGADVVIETTGRSDQFAPCVDLLRWGGRLLLQGWYPDPITFDFHATHQKKPTIAVTCGFDGSEVATCLELMRHEKLRLRELLTHLVPFADAPGIYARLVRGDPDVLGIVFDWTT